jgi:hypothetical protein
VGGLSIRWAYAHGPAGEKGKDYPDSWGKGDHTDWRVVPAFWKAMSLPVVETLHSTPPSILQIFPRPLTRRIPLHLYFRSSSSLAK